MNTQVSWILSLVRASSEVLTAAIAIASFSLLLFSLSFVKKEKLARILALILTCLTIITTAEALSTTGVSNYRQMLLQKLHWSGIILLLAFLYHFSEVLLQMTGQISRLLRRMLLGFVYLVSIIFLIFLWNESLFAGIRQIPGLGVTMVPAELSMVFWTWFGILLVSILVNFLSALRRTRTPTSRRRMLYLIFSSIGVLFGTMPLVVFGSGFLSAHILFFWSLSAIANLIILIMVFLLGYAVISFCVSWSYRVIRLRLLEWILRGPVIATLTLGIITLVRRSSDILSISIGGLPSLITVVSIVILEYGVTLLMPFLERNSIAGYGRHDYQILSGLENMIIFSSELVTYLESIISALCDQFQAKGAFIAVIDPFGNVEEFTHVGGAQWDHISETASHLYNGSNPEEKPLLDDRGILLPVFYRDNQTESTNLLAIIGITGPAAENFDESNEFALKVAADRIRIVLWQRWYTARTFSVLRQLSQDEKLGAYRKSGLLNTNSMLTQEDNLNLPDVSSWVRDALTHFWGGPRLTENPLIQLEIVQRELQQDDHNPTNALRNVLRQAIDHIRPEGERNISGEWTLYNILEMKFIEGLRVKEVAQRLAISEADLYRKQKVAIEEIAKTIIRMEKEGLPRE